MNTTRAACEVTLHPGMIHAERAGCVVRTVLGSCVAVCLYDPATRCGGINHYILPLWNGDGLPSPRYGNVAIAKLIERMLGFGCLRGNLRAKLFGGGAVLGASAGLLNVGERNVQLADDLLAEERVPVVARDVGGGFSRKVLFNTETGEVLMRKLGNVGGVR